MAFKTSTALSVFKSKASRKSASDARRTGFSVMLPAQYAYAAIDDMSASAPLNASAIDSGSAQSATRIGALPCSLASASSLSAERPMSSGTPPRFTTRCARARPTAPVAPTMAWVAAAILR